jgi:hypothetical protein
MATHHSKTRGAKSSNDKIVVPPWDSVWESFKKDHTKTTVEAMESEGWKMAITAAKEIGLSRQGIFDLIANGKMESTKKKVFYSEKTREVTFVRPKI